MKIENPKVLDNNALHTGINTIKTIKENKELFIYKNFKINKICIVVYYVILPCKLIYFDKYKIKKQNKKLATLPGIENRK